MTSFRAPRTPLTRTLLASTAALAVLGTVAACGGSDGAPAPAASVSVAPSATPAPVALSPFTGLPMEGNGGAVLAVKLDNTPPALPHIGLTAADIVYVEQVEGGLTRLAVVFASKKPKQVAPVRSARETDAELLPTFGKIPLAFSGSVASVHADIKDSGLVDVSEDLGGLGYTRLTTRYAPYNLAGDPKVLLKRAGKAVRPSDIGLTFGPVPAGGRAASKVTANFPSARIGFKYDEDTNRWTYSLNGQTDKAPGASAASASTVIVQYVSIGTAGRADKLSYAVPFAHSIGSGKALIARDGKVYNAKWSRKSESAPTKWTYNGADFPMGPGQQWIVLAPKTSKSTVSYVKTATPSASATPAS